MLHHPFLFKGKTNARSRRSKAAEHCLPTRRAPHRGQLTKAKKLDPAKPGQNPASPHAEATPAALHLACARGDAGSACARNAVKRGNAPPPPSLGQAWTSPAAPPAAAKRGRDEGDLAAAALGFPRVARGRGREARRSIITDVDMSPNSYISAPIIFSKC